MKKYIYNVELLLNNKINKYKAYYDSGNTYVIKDYPIIYLKDEKINSNKSISSFSNNRFEKYEKGVLKYTINKEEYYRTVLVIKVSDKEDFYGCDMLLNACLF